MEVFGGTPAAHFTQSHFHTDVCCRPSTISRLVTGMPENKSVDVRPGDRLDSGTQTVPMPA